MREPSFFARACGIEPSEITAGVGRTIDFFKRYADEEVFGKAKPDFNVEVTSGIKRAVRDPLRIHPYGFDWYTDAKPQSCFQLIVSDF